MPGENQLQAENVPLNIAPNDPELPKKTYQIVVQLSDQITALRNRVRELEDRVLN